MAKLDLKTASFGVLRAVAIQLARDIDAGEDDKRDMLAQVFALIRGAR